jgi:tetratricopeptide (TPR) repeat protein
LFAAAASALATWMHQGLRVQRVLSSALVLLLGVLTWRQAGLYQNMGTLWGDTAVKNPGSWMAHANLGGWLVNQQQFDEEIAEFRKAIQINPKDFVAQYNLGWELMRKQKVEEAIGPFTAAVEAKPNIAPAGAVPCRPPLSRIGFAQKTLAACRTFRSFRESYGIAVNPA